jgi:hypothetical protein
MSDNKRSSLRETMLTVMLLTVVVGGSLVFAVGIMGVFVIHALLMLGILVCFGMLHWLLWGRSMSEQAEREREDGQALGGRDEAIQDGPHGPTRY